MQIINDKTLFESKILYYCSWHGVGTIGGVSFKPKGQRNINIKIKDDDGITTQVTLHNALCFPDSPSNIISVACLVDLYDEDFGTFIKTSRHSS